MIAALRWTGGLGFCVFSLLLVITFAMPDGVERAGQTFIRYQLNNELRERIDPQHLESAKNAAALLSRQLKDEIEETKRSIDIGLPKFIAGVIADLCRTDCPKSEAVEQKIDEIFQRYLARLSIGSEKLTRLVQGRYREIVENLTLDLRIFLSGNALAFALVLFLNLSRPDINRQLVLPSFLLLISTTVSIAIYIFGQNWFFTLLYDDYMGIAYIAYLAVIFLFLCDIAMNKARLTTGVVGALGGVVAAICP